MKKQLLLFCFGASLLAACKKDFLGVKPSSGIVNPTTLENYQSLLDNNTILNQTGALPQMSSDEYFIVGKSDFDALNNSTYKGAYLWQKDLYGGEINQPDWNHLYKAVFYANSVLDGLQTIVQEESNRERYNEIKGQALFFRAFAFFDLIRNFSTVYNQSTAATDPGIPLRLSSGIDLIVQRATVQETFDQIIKDLNQSRELLSNNLSKANPNRPSKSAVYAMLARIYLYMGKYAEAGNAADECLKISNTIIDYNTLDLTTETPFSYNTDETLFFSTQVYNYDATTGYTSYYTNIGVSKELIALYDQYDLRLSVFFERNKLGNFNLKRGYVGSGFYPFTGLATDEIMLIKAECAARNNDPATAISTLNKLLTNRYEAGHFVPLSAPNAATALAVTLRERRKELVWRALRWSDLKRYNRDGAGIILTRTLNGQTVTLNPNSPLYVFPIPDDEISLNGIQQNIR